MTHPLVYLQARHLNLRNYQISLIFYLVTKEHTIIYRHISDSIFRIDFLLIAQHHSLMNMIFRGIQELIKCTMHHIILTRLDFHRQDRQVSVIINQISTSPFCLLS